MKSESEEVYLIGEETAYQYKRIADHIANIKAMLPPADFRRVKPLNQRQKRKRWRQNPNSKFARKS